MKLKKWIVYSSVLVSAQALAIDCNLPCGAEELVTCAAQAVGNTAEQYYNTVLFNTNNLDGYCKAPIDLNGSVLQQAFYTSYCTQASITTNGGYFSYANFISAATLFPEFGCYPGTTKERRFKELSNFLTTIAQETTSAASGYTNDGLYFRYENSVLLPADCTTQAKCWQYPTAYFYQSAPYYVASSTAGSGITYYTTPYSQQPSSTGNVDTYTNRFWQPDAVPPAPSPIGSGGSLYYVYVGSPVQLIYQWNNVPNTNATTFNCPAGGEACTLTAVNNTTMLPPAMWIGMGAKQLTADTMFSFFGYYFQHPEIQENPAPTGFPSYTGLAVPNANFYNFVNQFLVDGKLAFIGAFWYWMERINGQTSLGFRPIHTIVNDPNRPVCQDIATVTRMVNGGCNHYDRRLTYYRYFNSTFHIQTNPIIEGSLDSLVCSLELQSYCEKG